MTAGALNSQIIKVQLSKTSALGVMCFFLYLELQRALYNTHNTHICIMKARRAHAYA